jgi:hypothetical protein
MKQGEIFFVQFEPGVGFEIKKKSTWVNNSDRAISKYDDCFANIQQAKNKR